MVAKNYQKVNDQFLVINHIFPYNLTITTETVVDNRTLTIEYTFIRYVPLWKSTGFSRTKMRDDFKRMSGNHTLRMQDGILQGDETQKGL